MRFVVCQNTTPDRAYYVWDTSGKAIVENDIGMFAYTYTRDVEIANRLAARRNLAEVRRTRQVESAAKGEPT